MYINKYNKEGNLIKTSSDGLVTTKLFDIFPISRRHFLALYWTGKVFPVPTPLDVIVVSTTDAAIGNLRYRYKLFTFGTTGNATILTDKRVIYIGGDAVSIPAICFLNTYDWKGNRIRNVDLTDFMNQIHGTVFDGKNFYSGRLTTSIHHHTRDGKLSNIVTVSDLTRLIGTDGIHLYVYDDTNDLIKPYDKSGNEGEPFAAASGYRGGCLDSTHIYICK